jgi:hypothetical protein
MITSTFCHIPRIGVKTESRLWRAGAADWDAFETAAAGVLGQGVISTAQERLLESRERLDAGDASWFTANLPVSESWRLYGEFAEQVGYLDIETTGLGARGDHITTIALYGRGELRTYVWGDNLDDFENDVMEFKVIASYNGKCFDVPIIERHFGGSLPQAHVDLRHVLSALGYKGGLKRVEKSLGLGRNDLDGVDGYFAVLLWNEWDKYGDESALETLLAYNAADAVNLERLLAMAYNMRLENTPFSLSRAVDEPPAPAERFCADPDCVARVRARYGV